MILTGTKLVPALVMANTIRCPSMIVLKSL